MSETKFPLVSVIIPTYNRPKLLQETIESVLAQTYPNIEVVVVDDGSTDDTPEMLKQYEGRIVNVRKPNEGGTAARNTGITAARGEYLNFLDHDDVFLPTKIERQMEIMNTRPEVGLVHCGYYRMDKDGRYIDIVNFLPEGDVRPVIVLGCFCWSGAPLIRRECIDKVGVFDETVWSSDADMWLKIAIAGYHFGCVQEPLGGYRILADSSMADVERTERMDMAILDRVFANPTLPQEAKDSKEAAYFNQRFWLACRYYTLGKWEDAQRNLRVSLQLRPALLNKWGELLQLFCTNALDPRVGNPVEWVDNVFDHLIPEVETLIGEQRGYLKSWVLTGLSMRNYAYGRIEEAKHQFAEAIAFNPALVDKTDEFSRTLSDYALRLPVVPGEYVDCVLTNLPTEGAHLATLRNHVFSEVNIASAFRDYKIGHLAEVPPKVLSAVRIRPLWLKNRGVLSILVKSLPGWFSAQRLASKAV